MKAISDYEIIIHGVEHHQYFQGCGISGTSYEDVATGVGSDANEAYDNALECLAMGGWDVDSITEHVDSTRCELPEDASDEMYVYVSVRVK